MIVGVTELLKQAKKWAKAYRKEMKVFDIKVAVVGSYSIQYFIMALRYLLYCQGINADIYEGNYNGIFYETMDQKSELYCFQPDIVILLPYYLDIADNAPKLFATKDDVCQAVNQVISYYQTIWNNLYSQLNCLILQSNFVLPAVSQLGNLECNYSFSQRSFMQKVNLDLTERHFDFVKIIDFEMLASEVGKERWFDYTSYFLNKTGFHVDYLGSAVNLFVNIITANRGKLRKCLVLDLDDTIWGGIVGEVGWEGIQIEPSDAIGEAYRFFQKYILDLKNRGVVLAVCSKNEERVAKEPFEKNENMLLRLSDIACFVANWNDKVSNIKLIAQDLNIGLDSMVFFDDNPSERLLVQEYLPEVKVIDVPEDPADYTYVLDKSHAFDWIQITQEDVIRSSSYVGNIAREKLKSNFDSYEEYLLALEMEAETFYADEKCIERFTQLINKTNQFNLRTRRYTEADIRRMMTDKNFCCICVRLKDRFSQYGIVSCVILSKKHLENEKRSVCFIDTWVMSCRVFKRTLEYYVFCQIRSMANAMNCEVIYGEYIPSIKNLIVKNFYEELGFKKVRENIYKKDVKDEFDKKFYVK